MQSSEAETIFTRGTEGGDGADVDQRVSQEEGLALNVLASGGDLQELAEQEGHVIMYARKRWIDRHWDFSSSDGRNDTVACSTRGQWWSAIIARRLPAMFRNGGGERRLTGWACGIDHAGGVSFQGDGHCNMRSMKLCPVSISQVILMARLFTVMAAPITTVS